ncbi:mitochondrial ribosome-associated GTPase 1 [Carex littledalei]|uniref:Mitochondrial ribosome-associated GTPase 1 n=1 Tax=Carex littledalei TaxID=544730 RepID=A0A833QU74_9POAL|nr:mitochondrial ribosome-associated GTPase 1 [Carex littledalei]
MGGVERAGKRLAEMGFNSGGGVINWFPGHMAAATRAIRQRLKLADLVIEVRDARIPLSSAHEDLQSILEHKRRIIALNKKDLANPNIMHHWVRHLESSTKDCLSINAHSRSSVNELLGLVEFKLREVMSREPTLLVMVVGVPNVGKSALINCIHRIATSRFPVHEKVKRATVGPLPGVTQDISGFKIANRPSIYVLDTPGVLVPKISDMETGLKLALTGAVKDSVVGEERLAKYMLSVLNTRRTPLHWERLVNRSDQDFRRATGTLDRDSTLRKKQRKHIDGSDVVYIQDLVKDVQRALFLTYKEFEGNIEEETELEILIDAQFDALQKVFRIPQKQSDEARLMVSKKLLTLFRTGKLGPFILDNLPDSL